MALARHLTPQPNTVIGRVFNRAHTDRLLSRFDWRETSPWVRGEMLRGTDPSVLFEVAAGCVASVALQVAGFMTRSQMREAAQAIMTKAAFILEEDIEKVIQVKKDQTVLHNRIRLVRDP